MMTIISILFIAFLPGLIWLFFFLREDCHPEPKGLIIQAFLIGALATSIAILFQFIFQGLISGIVPGFLISFVIFLFGLALIEEVVKFWAANFTVANNREFDEPIDAMIYMAVAALGFATMENVLVISGVLTSLDLFMEAANVGLLRFIGATLLHVLASSLVGYYWARVKFFNEPKRILYFGIFLATIIHGVFNYLIIVFHDGKLIIPGLFIIFTAFFIFVDFEKLKHKKTD